MNSRNLLLLFCVLNFTFAFSQKSLLQSGPMVGYCEMREAVIWVQTKAKADVKISYKDKNTGKIYSSEIVSTEKSHSFTAKLIADSVSPGIEYEYTVFINNIKVDFDYITTFKTKPLWQFRTDAPDFVLATGSCAYINEEPFDRPGKPYGGDYNIFESIAEKKPDIMLWLGDNTYFREADWFSGTGMRNRYTHTRSLPQIQKLLATASNYAIWDDHDFGPNDSDKSFAMKNTSLDVFKDFWANPTYGFNDVNCAFTMFSYSDCDFFLLDNRFFRDADDMKGENKTVLGKEQLDMLKNSLSFSKAKIKFVAMGGQFLTTSKDFETYSNYGFLNERNDILNYIETNKISNVIFISGDRHFSEISALSNTENPVYDITVSPFTSSTSGKKFTDSIVNDLRVAQTLIYVRNFATISVNGPKDKRKINIVYFDVNGKEIISYEIQTK